MLLMKIIRLPLKKMNLLKTLKSHSQKIKVINEKIEHLNSNQQQSEENNDEYEEEEDENLKSDV